MRLRLDHVTQYTFDAALRGVTQSLRLWPSQFEGQTTVDWSVDIDGATRGAAFRDGAGDWIETASVLGHVNEIVVKVQGEIETLDTGGILRGHRERVPPVAYLNPTRKTEPDDALKALAHDAVSEGQSALDQAHALNAAVRGAIDYIPGQTGEGTTASEAMAMGKGVCQDHSHAMIACAGTLGLPARYVSGYLNATGGGADASHAWTEVWIEGLGWVGFDASNGVSPDENYIRIGSGLDATDAAPIRGMARGHAQETLQVDVNIVEV